MSVQDDKVAGQDGDQQTTEKPEPDEDPKRKAAEMMAAYQDRPTLVLPGSGGMVSGTAVNDWLDEDGNPKYNNEVPYDVGSDDKGSDDKANNGQVENDEAKKDQIKKDNAWNAELREAAAAENKGEKR
jgi:hypothetical protein